MSHSLLSHIPLLLLHHNNRVTTLEAICCFDRKTHLEEEKGMQQYSLPQLTAGSDYTWCKTAFSPQVQLHMSICSSSDTKPKLLNPETQNSRGQQANSLHSWTLNLHFSIFFPLNTKKPVCLYLI